MDHHDGIVHFDLYGKIFVASIQGTPRLDQSNHDEFGQALQAHIEDHPGCHLLINFSGVEFISSAVLSEIIHAMRLTEKEGGSVRVCAMNKYVASVFEVTQLMEKFKAGGHVRDAAEAFNQDIDAAEV